MDHDGEVAHFASGGRGFLPSSVKASRENLARLTDFFRESLLANGESIISPNLSSHVQFKSEEERMRFLADYSKMAAKGLYSFDCEILPFRPTNYYLVAKPSHPLKEEKLPDEFRELLRLIRISKKLSKLDEVQPTDL
jgi:hypothetical protein